MEKVVTTNGADLFLRGFGIQGFRSFGSEMQRIGPLEKINIFAGQNNSGKSNILRALLRLDSEFSHFRNNHHGAQGVSRIDAHCGLKPAGGRLGIGIEFNDQLERYLRARLNQLRVEADIVVVKRLLSARPFTLGTSLAWADFDLAPTATGKTAKDELIQRFRELPTVAESEWQYLWNDLTNNSGGSLNATWIPVALAILSPPNWMPKPEVVQVDAYRQVGKSGSKYEGLSGQGLIDKLAELERPTHENVADKQLFGRINEFVRLVTNNKSATIEIPADRSCINVSIDSKFLPLESLGTGTHQVIVLAAAATVTRNKIVCIEEPETFLHPTLQRRLIEFLGTQTDNQYFITTHSATVLDVQSSNTALFHVTHDGDSSKVTRVSSAGERAETCADLGYRASAIVQANCIIWVEGPSDRLYVNWWIHATKPDLIEGLHYSIMFYGGRLLSHLSAEDPEVTEFISLRRLNRNIAIVIDSDKSAMGGRVNDTKKRVIGEFNNGPGFAWVTAGREIENYIAEDQYKEAMKRLYGVDLKFPGGDRFVDRGKLPGPKKVRPVVDKMKLAHRVVQDFTPDLSVYDLAKQIKAMITFIEQCNSR